MWYLIVTARSLTWMLLSLITTLIMLSALFSPSWITTKTGQTTVNNETIKYTPSLGVYAKCSKPMPETFPVCTLLSSRGLAAESHVFPDAWKAATFFISLGLSIMTLTVIASLFSCCFQSIMKKSIFTLSGAAQCTAGICFILGVMLHPMAWGTTRVQRLCGREASPFYLGECSLGSGIYLAVVGTAMTFVAACLSLPAEKATSSDKVQDRIYEGQTLICLA